MKKMFIPVLMLLFAGGIYAQNTPWFNGSLDQAKMKASQESKLIVLDFSTDGG